MEASTRRYVLLTACRNEVLIVERFLAELTETLAQAGLLERATLVIVDDLSFDGTRELLLGRAAAAGPGGLALRVVQPATNLGNQGAMFFGLQRVDVGPDDLLISLDCDGEDDVREVPSVIAEAERAPGKVVLIERGSRRESLVFKAAFATYKRLFRLLTRRSVVPNNFLVIPGRFVPAFQRSPLAAVHFAYALYRLNPPFVATVRGRRTRYGGHTSQDLFTLVTHGLVGIMLFFEVVVARLFVLLGLFAGAGAVVVTAGAAVPDPRAERLLGWAAVGLAMAALGAAGLLCAAALALGFKMMTFWLAQEAARAHRPD